MVTPHAQQAEQPFNAPVNAWLRRCGGAAFARLGTYDYARHNRPSGEVRVPLADGAEAALGGSVWRVSMRCSQADGDTEAHACEVTFACAGGASSSVPYTFL